MVRKNGKPGKKPGSNLREVEIMENKIPHDLIVTIVNKGDAEKVVDASKKAGAEGGTIILGRGTGIHEQTRLFGIVIEPQKDIVLTLVKRKISDQVLEAIVARAELNKPGRGIAYVIPVERVAGITHLIPEEE
jgi:nitrogen regulatory protein PII